MEKLSCQTFVLAPIDALPHMPATALRLGHVRLIVRGQVYDGRITIHTMDLHYTYSILYCNPSQLYRVLLQIYSLVHYISFCLSCVEVGFKPINNISFCVDYVCLTFTI